MSATTTQLDAPIAANDSIAEDSAAQSARSAQVLRSLWRAAIGLLALVALLHAWSLSAQTPSTFQAPGSLSFTKPFGGANPLPQVFTAASAGAKFQFYVSVVNGTGGSWLSIGTAGSYNTPEAVIATAIPDITLSAGTYTAQIVLTPSTSGSTVITIPVSLTVAPVATSFFDMAPGALTFSLQTKGLAPPAQLIPVRNAGAGTLNFTAAATTADGGGWLSLSATSGTAPALLSAAIDPSKLPGSNLLAGTFTGQVVLRTSGSTVTIPVTVSVGDSVFRQTNALNFTKPYGGANPLPQVITLASTNTKFQFYVSAVNSTGGSWLSIATAGYYNTPEAVQVTANPAVDLVPGTYTGEVIATSNDGTQPEVIPVSLTVEASTLAFFDDVPGSLSFSLSTGGIAPPAQPIPVRNAGTGTLNFTATATTSDSGGWITLSANGGSAPALLNATIDPSKLPGHGIIAGTFTGQVLLQTNGDSVTVPVTVTMGDSVFRQTGPLNFTKVRGSVNNPLPQVFTLASTNASFQFYVSAVNSTGGNWLSIGTAGYYNTPQAITATASPIATLTAGVYTAEIIAASNDGTQSAVVPVTLTIEDAATTAFFDALPGQLTFSMATGGSAPPAQPVQIRNVGPGVLSFTTTVSTSDSSPWLSVSETGGSAPSVLTVSVNPTLLPGNGIIAGTFTGRLVLQTAGDTVTIPVTVSVGTSVFNQVNALNFVRPYAYGTPLPQVVSLTSTGAQFQYYVSATTSTGGNWLSVGSAGYYNTPQALPVTATPAVNLAIGNYTGQIEAVSNDGKQSSVIPVTLTIASPNSAFFDATPGALTFSGQPNPGTLGTLPLPIRNAGTGTLNWTATTSTADGGNWLSLSFSSGTAPSTPVVRINPAALPNNGFIAGTFVGQVLLQGAGLRVTVPVIVTLADSAFVQTAPLGFSKSYQGTNPPAQTLTLTSTNAALRYYISASNATGGNWLSISSAGYYNTGQSITVTAAPAANLAIGTYSAEVVAVASDGTQSAVIPVTLYVGTTAVTGGPSLSLVSGANQSGAVGTQFSAPVVLQVKDGNGNALANAAVSFTGDGLKFSPSTVLSDSTGRANTFITPVLGGVHSAVAALASGNPFVLFKETGTATATTTAPYFASMAILPTGASSSGQSLLLALADYNGDGVADLAATNLVDGTFSLLNGNGDGTFQSPLTGSAGNEPLGVAAGDFNGDGKPDLAVVNGLDGSVSILLNNGVGLPQLASSTYPVGVHPYGVSAADLDRNGVLDLVVTNDASQTLSVLFGNGDGTFAPAVSYATGTLPFGTAVADLNGDGYPDLVVWNAGDNNVGVLLNDRTGHFAAQVTYATGVNPFSVSTGDFNGDGYADLAVANINGKTVSVLLNSGAGKFLPAVAYKTGSLPASVLAVDLNRDGVLDLAVTNLGDGTVGVLLGKGDGSFITSATVDAGIQPYALTTADFNGDGRPDLAVTSFYSSSLGILLETATPNTSKAKAPLKIFVPPTTGGAPR